MTWAEILNEYSTQRMLEYLRNEFMSKFKVGDRVAFYSGSVRRTGTINKIVRDDYIEVLTGEIGDDRLFGHLVHPKQCRKLVKKARREFWVSLKDPGVSIERGSNVFWAEDKAVNEDGWIKVRECK